MMSRAVTTTMITMMTTMTTMTMVTSVTMMTTVTMTMMTMMVLVMVVGAMVMMVVLLKDLVEDIILAAMVPSPIVTALHQVTEMGSRGEQWLRCQMGRLSSVGNIEVHEEPVFR